MKVSRVQLVSVRHLWARGQHPDHTWPTWNFLVIGNVLVIGDLGGHPQLLSHSGLEFNGSTVITAAGSFRIDATRALKNLGWNSEVIGVTTPPEAQPTLTRRLLQIIDEHGLPSDPRHEQWSPPS